MGSIVFLTGAIVVTLGIYLYLAPESLRPLIEWAIDARRIRRIGVFRILLAVAFYFAAAETRLPLATLIIAGITLLAGLATLAMPFTMVQKLMNWWLERADTFTTPLLVIELAFGLFLMWLGWPETDVLHRLPGAG